MSDLVGFILAPHVMCIMFAIYIIKFNRDFEKFDLKLFIISVLYPVSVPAWSVYCSCREIFLGEDWTEVSVITVFDLTGMKTFKMFEYIGEFYVTKN